MSYETVTHGRLTWTNITEPTAADMRRLSESHPQFHPLDLEDCLSTIERPKIDEYDDYLFIVMHFPIWDARRRVSVPGEVDFFFGSGFVVTVSDGDLKAVEELFADCRDKEEARAQHMGGGASRLLHIVADRLVDYIFPMLYHVSANIRAIEETMFEENARDVIQTISFVRRDIISLRRIIRAQLPIIRNLEVVDRPFIREELDVYFGDILDHLQKASDFIDDNSEVIVALADTNDTLVSYRINEVMRILTVISVIMLPLTLVSGILGMNIPLPLPARIFSFWGVMGMMGVISISMLLYFRYRRWL